MNKNMNKKLLLAVSISVFLALMVLVAFWWRGNYFRQPDTASKEFDIYADIDYDKYEQIGFKREKVDKLFEALINVDKKLQETPNDYEYMLQLAGYKTMLQEYDSALATYEQAISLHSEWGPAYAEAGNLYVYPYADYQKAAEYYQKAVDLAPYRSDYYRWLADLYVAQFPERLGEVEQLMVAGAKANAGNEAAFYSYLITFFSQQGNIAKAVEYAQKTLQYDPDNENVQRELAEFQAQL
ncbi:MAG TPA: hypothetical protein PK085_02010 [bacterium]|nr:hypothetical protein [bacterium]